MTRTGLRGRTDMGLILILLGVVMIAVTVIGAELLDNEEE